MLKIDKCTKSFKKNKALDEFTAELETGVYGLLGPNGAGKTTLMRCICGIYKYDSGEIISDSNIIGYLPQKFGMFRELKVYELMQYFCILKKLDKKCWDEQIRRCVDYVNLSERINDKVSSLSGGMVRRIGIAQAILGDPKIILFDEPTAGLDPEERMRFKNILQRIKENKTIIISTHIVSDVESICGEILIMDKGKMLVKGSGVEIAKIAEGKTYIVREEDMNRLVGNYYTKENLLDNGSAAVKILSGDKQPFAPVSPSIEDGYLCVLKNL